MDIVCAQGHASLADVSGAGADPLSYSAVRALTRLGILTAAVLVAAGALPLAAARAGDRGRDERDLKAKDKRDAEAPKPRLKALRQPSPATQAARRSMAALWQALGNGSYGKALDAARQMAARGDAAMAHLQNQLQPPGGSANEIAGLIRELGSKRHASREKATQKLAMLGGAARGALQRAASGAVSAEVRQRALALLTAIDDPATPRNRRLAWAVGVLGALDTPKSAALLTRLAAGPKDVWVTRRAVAARERLAEAARMLLKPQPAILEMRVMPSPVAAAPWIRPETLPQALASLARRGPGVDVGSSKMFRWFRCDLPLPTEAVVGVHKGKTYVLLWERTSHLPGSHRSSRSDPWEMARVLVVADDDGAAAVEFELGKHAANRVRTSAVGSKSGGFVALMVGERIVSVARRDSDRLSPKGTLYGLMSAREARAIVRRLRAGMTPVYELAEAIQGGKDKVARRILDDHPGIERMQLDVRGLHGRTPLHVAVAYKRWEIAQLLLDRGADVNATGKDYGRTPLHGAAERGSTRGIQFLVKRGGDVKTLDKSGLTPLHLAVSGGMHAEAVKLLLDAGADVNSTGKAGITPLTLALLIKGSARRAEAIKAGQQCIDLLVSRGAKLDVFSAAALGRIDDLKAILAGDAKAATTTAAMVKLSPLAMAAFLGQLRAAEMLLKAGADPNGNPQAHGIGTPLLAAAGRGHSDIVKLLLAHKADPMAVDADGGIPILAAAWGGSTETIKALLDAGVPIDAAGRDGRTALHAAAGKGWKDAVALLLARGANPNVMAKYQGTPLHSLCGNVLGTTAGRLEEGQDYAACLNALVKAGADVNATNSSARTPLHVACGRSLSGKASPQRIAVVRSLLKAGADVNAVVDARSSGYRGKTPILFAAETADAELIKVLLDAGADPFIEPGGGSSQMPVEIASGRARTSGQKAYELLKAATEKREHAVRRQVEATAGAFLNAVSDGDEKTALPLTLDGLNYWSSDKCPARIRRLQKTFALNPGLLRTIVALKVRPHWAEVRTAAPARPPQAGLPAKERCTVFILMRMPDNTWRVVDFREVQLGAHQRPGAYLQSIDVGDAFRRKVFRDAAAKRTSTRPAGNR